VDQVSSQPALSHVRGQNHNHPSSGLAKFTTWGCTRGLSLGRVTASTIRLPGRLLRTVGSALSAPGKGLRLLGDHVAKNGNWFSRAAGAMLKGLGHIVGLPGKIVKGAGNVIGGVAGLVGHAVTFGEKALIASVKGLGAFALGTVSLIGTVFTAGQWSLPKAGLSKAGEILKNIWMTQGEPQVGLTKAKAQEMLPRAKLMAVTCSSHDDRLPDGFTSLRRDEIPAKYQKWFQEPTNGDVKNKAYLNSDAWSALRVSVTKSPEGKVILAFKGTDPNPMNGRFATVKSDLMGAMGVADSAFRDARDLVKAFVAKYGRDSVEVMGHSLGGALAQFSGIKCGIKVTSFNGMGLTPHLRDKLVDYSELFSRRTNMSQAQVEHFDTAHDPLSQKAQTRYMPFGLTQLGDRFKVGGMSGHSMSGVYTDIESIANS
jgi:hypothetical protein